jgi:hypothetical protein
MQCKGNRAWRGNRVSTWKSGRAGTRLGCILKRPPIFELFRLLKLVNRSVVSLFPLLYRVFSLPLGESSFGHIPTLVPLILDTRFPSWKEIQQGRMSLLFLVQTNFKSSGVYLVSFACRIEFH